MNIQFKKGVLELCVLVLLSERDRYGYELVHTISEQIHISEGTVYPLLKRMTKEGLCTAYLKESSEGPSRKYYRLTDAGKTHLRRLMADWKEFLRGVNRILEAGETDGAGSFSE